MQSRGIFAALLTDVSKTFDFIPRELFIAKLKEYGFQTDALNNIYDYLSTVKQRTNINEAFGSWKDIEYDVPQEFILGTPLLNIHVTTFTSLKIQILQVMRMTP